MKKYRNYSLQKYLDELSSRTPAPGGGSAAALVGSLAAALISMVAQYSLKKDLASDVTAKIKSILKTSESLRKRFLTLVDLDAQAYLKVVAARKGTAAQKQKALARARAVPLEVCQLCEDAIELTPYLVEKGNKYLLSDIEVALEFLMAAFNAARRNIEINQ